MKFIQFLAASALLTSLVACKAKDEAADQPAGKTTEAAPAGKPAPAAKASSGRSIPNSDSLSVDAPAKWLDNGVGGAAGLHLDADAGNFSLNLVTPEEAAKNMATIKSETEQMLFEKWVSSAETPDGFKLVYVIDKITMKGDEPVKTGTTLGFQVRRKIGGKLYSCSGGAETQAIIDEAVALCEHVASS